LEGIAPPEADADDQEGDSATLYAFLEIVGHLFVKIEVFQGIDAR
jgi:hypothetical protein